MRIGTALMTLSLALSVAACGKRTDTFEGTGEVDTFCRDNPDDCGGQLGGACEQTDDCSDGVCCTEKSNCGGGMCLFRCESNADCPENQRCEHKQCFFSCRTDDDCAPGQKCEHGDTICEWP